MKKLIIAILFIFTFTAMASAAPFNDVKASHWAYDAVNKLAAKGFLQGYKDGSFKGDKTLTRYELAMVISRLMGKMNGMGGVSAEDLRTLERLTVEFSDELALLGVKVTALEDEMRMLKADMANCGGSTNGKIAMSGDFRLRTEFIDREYDTRGDDDTHHYADYGMNFFANVDENVSAFVRFAAYNANLNNLGNTDTVIDEAYIDVKNFFELGDIRVGRQWMSLGHSIVLDDKMDGIKFSKIMDQVALTLFAFSTRDAATANRQYYGNHALASSNFYMFDDTAVIKNTTAVITDSDVANPGFNAIATDFDEITLYNSQYPYAAPTDSYTGLTSISTPNNLWNNHSGAPLNVGGNLAPVDVAAYVRSGLAATLDTVGTDTYATNNANIKHFQNETASGLDTWGLNISVDFGGHALAGYFMQREYDNFDPYTLIGDPWATMVDYDNDGVIDVDRFGRILSPSADPSYFGLTLDGNILRNVDYYLEYVNFDPDINNIGVDPLTAQAKDAAGNWNGNNMDDGSAWLIGIDWDLNDDLNLIIQYGVGDEEFIPASINHEQYLNGMSGFRPEDMFYGNSTLANPFQSVTAGGVGSGALTGIKDLIVKLSADFNEKTSGYIKYEAVSENDSSAERLISGDPMITGHARQEYDLITVSFKHIYKPNTILRLQYDYLQYDNDAVDNAHSINTNEAFVTDDVNGGGWSRLSADISVKF